MIQSLEDIQTGIQAIRADMLARGATFDFASLPKKELTIRPNLPSINQLRFNKATLHKILHRIFSIPFFGPMLNTLWMLPRLSTHINRANLERLKLEARFVQIEHRMGHLEKEFKRLRNSLLMKDGE